MKRCGVLPHGISSRLSPRHHCSANGLFPQPYCYGRWGKGPTNINGRFCIRLIFYPPRHQPPGLPAGPNNPNQIDKLVSKQVPSLLHYLSESASSVPHVLQLNRSRHGHVRLLNVYKPSHAPIPVLLPLYSPSYIAARASVKKSIIAQFPGRLAGTCMPRTRPHHPSLG